MLASHALFKFQLIPAGLVEMWAVYGPVGTTLIDKNRLFIRILSNEPVRNLSSKYYLHPIKCGCCSGILITGRANSQKTIAEWGNSLICSVRVSISLHPFLSSTQLCCANQHSQLRLEVWPQQKLRWSQWRYLQWRKKLSGIHINS